jgi:hypothetical protein
MPNTSRFIEQWIKINVLRHLILQQIKLENKKPKTGRSFEKFEIELNSGKKSSRF